MVNAAERLEGHCEVREAPYGRGYTCSPGRAAECGRGERSTLTFSVVSVGAALTTRPS